jgi:hypothetical protein
MVHKRSEEQKIKSIQQKSNSSKEHKPRSISDDKYRIKKEHFGNSSTRCNRVVKFLKLLFIAIIVLNILAPIVVYAWPGIMGHMIFQTFSYY